jgi:uncharacterized protein YggT (Ycf19 family)
MHDKLVVKLNMLLRTLILLTLGGDGSSFAALLCLVFFSMVSMPVVASFGVASPA